MKTNVGVVTSRNLIISFIDYQTLQQGITSIAFVVANNRISMFPLSSDYNRIMSQ